jgi:hypothetical protein
MGGAWIRTAAAHQIHDAELVDEDRIAVAAGAPALLGPEEAADVIEVLDAVAAASPAGAGRDRVEDLALLLRERLRRHAG